jgi:electron transport complex protein RnfC
MSTQLQATLGSFPGGLAMPHHKRLATQRRIQTLPAPTQLTIALAEHPGIDIQPLVDIGQTLVAGQPLCKASGARAANVHAPLAGQVISIEPTTIAHPAHPEGVRVPCVRLQTNSDSSRRCLPDIDTNDAEQLRQQIAAAGIVGLGGALYPSADKLATTPIETLIINGAECEPYIACDEALMLEQAEALVRGAQLAAQACGAGRVQFAIEDHRPETREQLMAAMEQSGDDSLYLSVVPTRYPEGGERQLIQVLTDKEVPAGGLPQSLGLAMLNIATVYAIYQAIEQAAPLTHRVVTVTGPGVRVPGNFWAPIGTPARALIAAAGGYSDAAKRLIMGGPMMGVALPHDDFPVTRATNCLLVLGAEDIDRARPSMPCIGCMDCVSACPAGLLPQLLHRAISAEQLEQAEQLDVFACIECGCCAEVCPSHIPLVEQYRYAKATLRFQAQERQRAEGAKQRFEARKVRLEKQKAEREARLRAKQERLAAQKQASSKSDAIAAAVARAKKKKQSGGDS